MNKVDGVFMQAWSLPSLGLHHLPRAEETAKQSELSPTSYAGRR